MNIVDEVWRDVLGTLEKKQTLDFPYEDYDIVGDTREIDRIIQSYGKVNVSIEDMAHTLSKKTVNYVLVGYACGEGSLVTALRNAVNKLPATLDTVSKLLLYLWVAEDSDYQETDWSDLSNYLSEVFPAIDLCWGIACDESFDRGQVRGVLIIV